MEMTFDELHQDRSAWVDLSRKKKFLEEGLSNLLTELYPDNAHFIYELLQNAEDAQATECHFHLTESAVEFRHNGTRLFTLADIEAITSIGSSTKSDDVTAIGKFGVGFKAVFAYTATPQIHSGDYDFHIRDLVVPEPIDPRTTNETLFVFPFNQPNKPATRARAEIKSTLESLGDNTLLFLRCIRSISFEFDDSPAGGLARTDLTADRIEILRTRAHDRSTQEASSSQWLRVGGDVFTDQGPHWVAIAFRLQERPTSPTPTHPSRDASKTGVIPVEGAQVSIYFPAVKELSGLRFHIHAPFASTVARDSVRDVNENDAPIRGIAEVLIGSLPTLRDRGLITDEFLATLPNGDDNIPVMYRPILDDVIQAFRELPLTPALDGGFYPAGRLRLGAGDFPDVLDEVDLTVLSNMLGTAQDGEEMAPLKWIRRPKSARVREFIRSLGVPEFGYRQISDLLHEVAFGLPRQAGSL